MSFFQLVWGLLFVIWPDEELAYVLTLTTSLLLPRFYFTFCLAESIKLTMAGSLRQKHTHPTATVDDTNPASPKIYYTTRIPRFLEVYESMQDFYHQQQYLLMPTPPKATFEPRSFWGTSSVSCSERRVAW